MVLYYVILLVSYTSPLSSLWQSQSLPLLCDIWRLSRVTCTPIPKSQLSTLTRAVWRLPEDIQTGEPSLYPAAPAWSSSAGGVRQTCWPGRGRARACREGRRGRPPCRERGRPRWSRWSTSCSQTLGTSWTGAGPFWAVIIPRNLLWGDITLTTCSRSSSQKTQSQWNPPETWEKSTTNLFLSVWICSTDLRSCLLSVSCLSLSSISSGAWLVQTCWYTSYEHRVSQKWEAYIHPYLHSVLALCFLHDISVEERMIIITAVLSTTQSSVSAFSSLTRADPPGCPAGGALRYLLTIKTGINVFSNSRSLLYYSINNFISHRKIEKQNDKIFSLL